MPTACSMALIVARLRGCSAILFMIPSVPKILLMEFVIRLATPRNADGTAWIVTRKRTPRCSTALWK